MNGSVGWKIGIGGHLAVPPLPHHRAYGHVPGGSTGLSLDTDMESRPGNHRRTVCAFPKRG
jgi:hypothetical protein